MSREPVYYPDCKNYLILFDNKYTINDNFELKKEYLNYDGYLCTIKFTSNPSMIWYPTVQNTDYVEVKPNKLLHLINKTLLNTKYSKVLKRLDRQGYCAYYGRGVNPSQFPNSYRGKIPYNGVSLLRALCESGIVLIIHRDTHNQMGIPSGKIFEAAAASCVIISDRNPFVLEHFGESVLYFDNEADIPTIFSQIDAHMQWIKENPEEALIKAKQAHTIFSEKFSLENQLLQLEKMHEHLLKIIST